MTYGVIGALEQEISLIKEKMLMKSTKEIFGSTFYCGEIHHKNVVLVKCNVGTINATLFTSIIIREFGADVVINVGVAGAMDKSLKILDVVISNEVVYHDADSFILKDFFPFQDMLYADKNLITLCKKACETLKDKNFKYIEGRIASGDVFVNDPDKKIEIKTKTNPCCVEMEGAAIGQVATMHEKPFLVIRAMSDNADDNATDTFENWVDLAAINSANIILKMLELANE